MARSVATLARVLWWDFLVGCLHEASRAMPTILRDIMVSGDKRPLGTGRFASYHLDPLPLLVTLSSAGVGPLLKSLAFHLFLAGPLWWRWNSSLNGTKGQRAPLFQEMKPVLPRVCVGGTWVHLRKEHLVSLSHAAKGVGE